MHAAVCRQVGDALELCELEVDPPRAGEVRVRVHAAGICASDLSVQHGKVPSPMPIVLGHEAAGVVAEVGPGVHRLAPGDHVAICAMPQCGACRRCRRGQPGLCEEGDGVLLSGGLLDGTPRLRRPGGDPVHQMVAAGTFAEETVVPEASVVRLPEDVPFSAAALLGCAVVTGAGAALNTATIREGDTVAIIGCGTVGLTAIQGARLAGAGRTIAVDLVPAKLELARACGATDVVDARDADPVAAVKDLTDGWRADVVIDAVGAQTTVDQAIAMTAKGGEVVFVGVGGPDVRIAVEQWRGLIGTARTFKGSLFGSADIHRDVPRLVEHYRAGDLLLEELVSRTLPLDEINDGFAALAGGDVVSAVVDLTAR